jgi:hypothetical protein
MNLQITKQKTIINAKKVNLEIRFLLVVIREEVKKSIDCIAINRNVNRVKS